MEKDINDPAVRWAIKQAHKSRCFLCNMETPIGDIDHYLPKALLKDPKGFSELKGLPSSFKIEDINNYHNLVWICKPCNQILKRTIIPDLEEWTSRYYYRIKPLISEKERLEETFRVTDTDAKIIPLIEKTENLANLLEFRENISKKISNISKKFIDQINQKITQDFPIIKGRFFPDSNLNIAISVYGKNVAFFAYSDKKSNPFCEATKENYEKYQSFSLSSFYTSPKIVLSNMELFQSKIIFDFIEKLFQTRLLKCMDKPIAIESIFIFLEKYYSFLFDLKTNVVPDSINMNILKDHFLKKFPKYNHPIIELNLNDLDDNEIHLMIIFEMIQFLEANGMETVNKPYKTHGGSDIMLTTEDIEYNLQFIYNNLRNSYQAIVNNNFPFLKTKPLPREITASYLINITDSIQIEEYMIEDPGFGKKIIQKGVVEMSKGKLQMRYNGVDYNLISRSLMLPRYKGSLVSEVYNILISQLENNLHQQSHLDRFDPSRFW